MLPSNEYLRSTFGERLDDRFGAEGTFWPFIDERVIPFISRMTLAMAGLMLLAAIVHGNLTFAAILIALMLLARRMGAEAYQE